MGNRFLIIVTGRPAAGKSTLAKQLSQELKIPLVSKDEIREVLFDRLGWDDRPWAQKLGVVSIDLMYYFAKTQLLSGGSIILDNAFDPEVTTPQIIALQAATQAKIIQIICNAESELLFNRFFERAKKGGRHPGHRGDKVAEPLRGYLARNHSPKMDLYGQTIELDTTDFSSINYFELSEKIRVHMQAV